MSRKDHANYDEAYEKHIEKGHEPDPYSYDKFVEMMAEINDEIDEETKKNQGEFIGQMNAYFAAQRHHNESIRDNVFSMIKREFPQYVKVTPCLWAMIDNVDFLKRMDEIIGGGL